jgi:hypothetical protein
MTTMANPSLIPVLTDLLRGEHGGLFRFLAAAEPYMSRGDAALRRPLAEMVAAAQRHEGELTALINELGGTAMPPGVTPDHQYLAFLSLEFLRPRLKESAQNAVARYKLALDAAGAADPAVVGVLKAHLEDYQRFLNALM